MSLTSTQFRDRLRRAIQDGKTSDGEVLTLARSEDLSEQVMAETTPTGREFQVRFTAVPTQGYVSVFVVPETLRAFVDGNTSELTPEVDVNSIGIFKLAASHIPAERLQVTYAWEYFQNASLEAFLEEARAWVSGPGTFGSIEEIPDGLQAAVVDFAASRALRALAAKIALANQRAGDSGADYADLMKETRAAAADRERAANAQRQSYYRRADQQLAPAAGLSNAGYRPYTPPR